jgi:hypothetical protein
MPDTPKQPNIRPDPKSKGTPPALKLTSRCPNCGRQGVVVFSVPPPAASPGDETHRLVCLHCVPKAAGDP